MKEGVPLLVIPENEESYCPTIKMNVPHGMIILE
jgi:hypothetical protein